MIYYTLNKTIPIEKLAQDLQKLVSQIPPEQLPDKVLVIRIDNISNYAGDSPLPKITYKE